MAAMELPLITTMMHTEDEGQLNDHLAPKDLITSNGHVTTNGQMTSIFHRESEGHDSITSKEGRGRVVAVVGSGDMAMALAVVMTRAGIQPVLGSRDPERARTRVERVVPGVAVTSIQEAVEAGEVVVVALHPEHHHTLPPHLLANKVVVDISNRPEEEKAGSVSVAERLQEHLPHSHVVKAFNTLSAYALRQGLSQGSKEVPVCGDSEAARGRVSRLVRELGLTVEDRGCLANARAVEDIPLAFFPEWRVPGIVALVLTLGSFLFFLLRRQICPNISSPDGFHWDMFVYLPLKNTMLSTGLTSALLLLACYVPGTVAGYVQLYRGTKYSWFPGWLDAWLKARKQLGLLALLIGAVHGCMAIIQFIYDGMTHPARWSEHLYLALGVLLLAAMSVLGVASLPSVSARLTWREFTGLQRGVGWASVLLLTGHVVFMGYRKFLMNRFLCGVIPHELQIMIPMCFLVVALQLPLMLPGIRGHLRRIRRGYERKPKGCMA